MFLILIFCTVDSIEKEAFLSHIDVLWERYFVVFANVRPVFSSHTWQALVGPQYVVEKPFVEVGTFCQKEN